MNHRWIAPMSGEGAWIELAWDEPQTIRHVQLTFDTGFHRELTLTVVRLRTTPTSSAPRSPRPSATTA